ncbi:MAG: hypothetical protein CL677_02135 [Bdellovibrionaceae bacterium]|nr:hypothetical protein [Pseudobdellovibrionaceae bacterium]|tara:strand:+ start:62580 stop:64538 length:1959 start_codon:yes stop_codon:yes gene_type:complete
MDKSKYTILIVEDDVTFLSALSEVFSREGYNVVACKDSKDAISQASFRQIHCAIVDCMLPKSNGVDVIHEIRSMGAEEIPCYLMSGIFRDRAFAADAKNKTNAIDYLFKPFNVDELVDNVTKQLASTDESVDDLHMSTFLTNTMDSSRERTKALDQLDSLTGFDLPFAISILLDGESTGQLTITSDGGSVYQVNFQDGKIIGVQSEDGVKRTLDLLIAKGHLFEEDLKEIDVSGKAPAELLQYLVDESYISPHMISIIQTEYILGAIKKLVGREKYQVKFNATEAKEITYSLQTSLFVPLIHEMISEGLETQWLQNFYETWFDIPMVKGPRFSPTHQVLYTPILAQVQGIEECLDKKMSLNAILSERPYRESDLLKAVHLMAIQRLISFDPTAGPEEVDLQDMERLITLKEQLSNKNAKEIFRFFGAGEMVSVPDVERIYKEVAKVHHPDKLRADTNPEKLELVKEIFTQITTAFDVLTNPEKREEFEKQVRQKDAEKQLKAEAILDDGIKELKRGKVGEAIILLEIANEMYQMPMAELYIQWAKLKQYSDEIAPDGIMQDAKHFFDTFPAEFRKMPEFFLVQGLYHVAKGDNDGAKALFEKALTKDSSFIEARRELSLLKADSKTNPTISEILNGDLSVVISGIFNKKKSS